MTATEVQKNTGETAPKLAGKYLTFRLGNESYGFDVLKIREIIRMTEITAVPQMPAYVKGVINLRGKIIPVMDLRLRFGLADEKSEHTCIVVVQVKLPEGRTTQMGLVVDSVEEVVNIAAGDIEETPDFGTAITADYLLGMAKIKGVVKALLNIDRIVGSESILQGQTF
ncbi:MAG TPA: chemotaxis protein CheW [Candidatus Paceibacterota bacterium]|nr:chemotaxis protein CheW [Candidatus Paceibacterota bacterium]